MHNIEIDTADLTQKLLKFEELAHGDPARIIELLLLENHVLAQNQSGGYIRQRPLDFSEFPRFLALTNLDVAEN